MIEVEGLCFEYPGKRVLQDVAFSVVDGGITALVGPNGAGKTTLLRCLVALEKPHGGRIRIGGFDVAENPREIHRMCGYLSDFFGLYDSLTVRQCITYAGWIHRLGGAALRGRTDEVMGVTAIADMADKAAGTLSRGYRQRLGIAMALVHDPRLLVLDEPASGMDPEARIGLSRLMLDLRGRGKTIIVSSHILNELEDYCTDMLVLRDCCVADHVKLAEYASRTLRIEVLQASASHLESVRGLPHVSGAALAEGAIVCAYGGGAADQAELLKALVQRGVPVTGISVQQGSLQDAYMQVTAQGGAKP